MPASATSVPLAPAEAASGARPPVEPPPIDRIAAAAPGSDSLASGDAFDSASVARAAQVVQRPDWRHYLGIAWFRALADFRSNSARLYLGAAWWILEPIAYVFAYYVAFVWIRGGGGAMSIGSLLIGIVLWKWFASSMMTGAGSVLGSGGLIRLVWLPKFLLPLTTSITSTLRFIFVLPILLMVLSVGPGEGVSWSWSLLPLALALNFALNLGVSAVLGAIVPFIPDLRIAIENALVLMMFVSGVFFDPRASASSKALLVLHCNPVASMIDIYRSILVRHEFPSEVSVVVVMLASLLTLWIGTVLLHRFDGEYAKVV